MEGVIRGSGTLCLSLIPVVRYPCSAAFAVVALAFHAAVLEAVFVSSMTGKVDYKGVKYKVTLNPEVSVAIGK
jgi:hypothetical protein